MPRSRRVAWEDQCCDHLQYKCRRRRPANFGLRLARSGHARGRAEGSAGALPDSSDDPGAGRPARTRTTAHKKRGPASRQCKRLTGASGDQSADYAVSGVDQVGLVARLPPALSASALAGSADHLRRRLLGVGGRGAARRGPRSPSRDAAGGLRRRRGPRRPGDHRGPPRRPTSPADRDRTAGRRARRRARGGTSSASRTRRGSTGRSCLRRTPNRRIGFGGTAGTARGPPGPPAEGHRTAAAGTRTIGSARSGHDRTATFAPRGGRGHVGPRRARRRRAARASASANSGPCALVVVQLAVVVVVESLKHPLRTRPRPGGFARRGGSSRSVPAAPASWRQSIA